MIVKGIKNFFINLKHFFTPLGAFAIGVIIGVSLFLPMLSSAFATLENCIRGLVESASIDFDMLRNTLWRAVRSLDWSHPLGAVLTVLSKDWLTVTLNECVNAFIDGGESVALIEEAVSSAITDISAGFKAFAVFAVLGLVGGYLLTKFLIRRNMARRSLGKWIVAAVVDTVLAVLLIILTVWINAISTSGGIVAAVLSLVLLGVLSLTEAYLVHGRKKVRVGQVVNIKNLLRLFAADIIIICITLAFALIIFAVANFVVGIFLCLPLVEIALIVMSFNAEAYVKDMVDGQNS